MKAQARKAVWIFRSILISAVAFLLSAPALADARNLAVLWALGQSQGAPP